MRLEIQVSVFLNEGWAIWGETSSLDSSKDSQTHGGFKHGVIRELSASPRLHRDRLNPPVNHTEQGGEWLKEGPKHNCVFQRFRKRLWGNFSQSKVCMFISVLSVQNSLYCCVCMSRKLWFAGYFWTIINHWFPMSQKSGYIPAPQHPSSTQTMTLNLFQVR